MKKERIPAIIMLILFLVITAGSRTFLSPCVHEDGSSGPCGQAGRTLFGLGCAACIPAVLSLCVKKARFGAYLSSLPVCAMGILTPGTLNDLCRMSTMRCRMVMQPAMVILFSAAFICSLAGAILSSGRTERR